MNSFFDLVSSRRSVRTFDGQDINSDLLQQLKDYAKEITNPYGIPVRFEFLDKESNGLSSPVLSGEKLYVSAMMNPAENADVAYGYAFQDLLMKAHELGLGTVWIGGTMPREKFEKASGLSEGEIMPCMSPLGKEAAKMSIKEGLMRKGVKADWRYDFEQLFFLNSFETPLTESESIARGINVMLKAVKLAPSAVNKQPWRVIVGDNVAHFYEKKDKGFDADGYDLQKIDLGIALYNFEKQGKEEGKDMTFELANPRLPVPEGTEYIASYRW